MTFGCSRNGSLGLWGEPEVMGGCWGDTGGVPRIIGGVPGITGVGTRNYGMAHNHPVSSK